MNNEKVMTVERLVLYAKKYWWILVLSFLIGLFGMFLSVKSNNSQPQKEVSYVQNYLPEIIDDEKVVSLSLAAGNCKSLLEVTEVQESINAYLDDHGGEAISDWSTIEVESVTNSNFFTITIAQDKETAEMQIQAITDILNDNLSEYEQNLLVVRVGGLQENTRIISAGQSIYLKDVLIFFISVVVGVFVVYILALFGKTIADPREVRMLLGQIERVCINKKNISLFTEWLKSLDDNRNNIFVMGKGTEQISDIINNCGNGNYRLEPIDKYGDVISSDNDSDIYLIIRRMNTSTLEIENIAKISEMYNANIDGWVYIKI
ncbi:hypothetical protein [Mediterraneibacter glycyrrhizinilyticus]|uniref:hypothetical protein n=1 Tax=Mediterraneibacter glycyrrhizinilyticus TaxID=342942 RepID=UPI0025A346B5|nr:hypothetical protein [Mediterraneibacter glycyrrhizinilyticus]MDM8125953.1 hypothetical protein [Mediterraneibacter glycyrrhizinilyticus]